MLAPVITLVDIQNREYIDDQNLNSLNSSTIDLQYPPTRNQMALKDSSRLLKIQEVTPDAIDNFGPYFDDSQCSSWLSPLVAKDLFSLGLTKGLNHNLFTVGQFCDADLEVAFRKSTCYIRNLKGNDLLTVDDSPDIPGTYLFSRDPKMKTPGVLIDFLTLVQRGLHA
ncbi:hypothetical protein Tco_0286907 [Tanacetum coccineum]